VNIAFTSDPWAGLFDDEENLLRDRPLEEVLRHAAAVAVVEAEEESAAISKRPTVPLFVGEPWR
jgi:hypothetical protein